MRWKGRRESGNVVDGRGAGPGGGRMRMGGGAPVRLGGGGIGMLVVVLIVSWVLGINPLTLLEGGGGLRDPSGVTLGEQRPRSSAENEMASFVRVVLAETEDAWNDIFAEAGADYPEPTLHLFTGEVRSACGFASSASGPFYCPADRKVYIDLAFYDELRRRFEAPGDFAQAYVIAHEVGHHVQNLIGVLPEFNRRRQSMPQDEANALSVRVELQADCFAGLWAAHAEARGLLEPGDVEEALNAATQIGDDAIQRRTQGYVVPESFNHGTSDQRRRWFRRGLEGRGVDSCDTFSPTDV